MPDSLTLHDVTKRYGGGPPVLDRLTAAFEPGTATGLIGPNGSGKTTLLRLLSVLSFPTSGTVRYGSADIHQGPYRYLRHTGIVHDTGDLPRYLTATELLAYVVREREQWDEAAPGRIAEWLDAVRLDERREALIGTYSTGMLRKTQLALAFVTDPRILLLDEPLRGLDVESRTAVLALLRQQKREGKIILIATHFDEALKTLCDRLITLPVDPF